ncbi:MAG: hypothetical protein JWQ27_2069 [Ferruginibacter sp.]|nr:hypothetical protein [Ferruginibacter sp.]
MKTSTMGIVTPINKDEMKELLKETKETLATDLLKQASEPFGAVSMWKVRKSYRSASSLRRII